MSEPFSCDEDGAAHMESECVMFERCSVSFPHQIVDECDVCVADCFDSFRETDSCRVDDRKVVCECCV